MSRRKSRKLIGPNQSKLFSTWTLPLLLPLLLLEPKVTEPSAATESCVEARARMVRRVLPIAEHSAHTTRKAQAGRQAGKALEHTNVTERLLQECSQSVAVHAMRLGSCVVHQALTVDVALDVSFTEHWALAAAPARITHTACGASEQGYRCVAACPCPGQHDDPQQVACTAHYSTKSSTHGCPQLLCCPCPQKAPHLTLVKWCADSAVAQAPVQQLHE